MDDEAHKTNNEWTSAGFLPTGKNKIYVFAAGGSGMRVVESLAMLTAAGYMDFTDHAIVPILFDPDEHNGNKLRTEEVLRAYKKIHRFAGKKGFFSHPVQPLIANKNLINIHKIDYFNKYDNNGQEPFKKDDELGKLTQSLFGLPHHNQITHVNRARLAMGDLASQQNLCQNYSKL